MAETLEAWMPWWLWLWLALSSCVVVVVTARHLFGRRFLRQVGQWEASD